jgi:hypothetical protein
MTAAVQLATTLLCLFASTHAHWQSQHHDSRNTRQADASFNPANWPTGSTLSPTKSSASSSDVTCSGVAVDASGNVWTTRNYGSFGTRTTVLKYAAANGTLACSLNVPSAQKSFSYVTGVSPITLNADSSLAFFAMEYSLFAVDTATCAQAWNVTVADDAFSVMTSRDAFTCSAPNVDVSTGLIYVNGQRKVHAFDPVKRARVWTGLDVGDPSEPLARERPASCNGFVFVTAVNRFHLQHTVAALNATDGSIAWNVTVKTTGFYPFASNIVVDKACAVVYLSTKQGLARYSASTGAAVTTLPTPTVAAGAAIIILMTVAGETTLVSLSNQQSSSGLMASPVTTNGAKWFIPTVYSTTVDPIASADGTVLFCPDQYLVAVALSGKNTTVPVSCSSSPLTLDADQQLFLGPQQYVVAKATTTTTRATTTPAATTPATTSSGGGNGPATTPAATTTVAVGTSTVPPPRGDVACGQVSFDKTCKTRFFQATYTYPKGNSDGHAALQQRFDVLSSVKWTGGVASDCEKLAAPFFKCDDDSWGQKNTISCPPGGVSMNGNGLETEQFHATITPAPGSTDCSGVAQLSISALLGGNGTCVAELKEVQSCDGSNSNGGGSKSGDGKGSIWTPPRGIGFIAACAAGGFLLLVCLPAFIIACYCVRKKQKNSTSQHVALLADAEVGDVPPVFSAKPQY